MGGWTKRWSVRSAGLGLASRPKCADLPGCRHTAERDEETLPPVLIATTFEVIINLSHSVCRHVSNISEWFVSLSSYL